MDDVQTGRVLQKLENIEKSIQEIKHSLAHDYITRKEFEPTRNIVYAMTALILIGFFGVLTALVYGRGSQTPLYNPQVVQSAPGNVK